MREVALTGGPVAVEGALGVAVDGDGTITPWRLPVETLDVTDQFLRFLAGCPAGVRLRLATDATVVELAVSHVDGLPDVPYVTAYDLVIDGTLHATVTADGLSTERQTITFDGLPSGTKVVEVWLPTLPRVRVHSLAVDDAAVTEPAPDTRPKWVTYGSSISHCLEVPSPTGTWPAVAAAARGWNLTSMGFAGNCHLDPIVGRAIAGMDVDRISMKLGINVHNGATLRTRTFPPLVHGLIMSIRDAKPTTPILIVSPIFSPVREDDPVSAGLLPDGSEWRAEGDMSLRQMRELLAEVVDLHQKRGDEHIGYLDGTDLFGPADVEDGHLPDGLHPSPEGYRRIGERFAKVAWPGH